MSINKTKTKNPKYNKKNSRPIFGRAKYITKNYKTIKSNSRNNKKKKKYQGEKKPNKNTLNKNIEFNGQKISSSI